MIEMASKKNEKIKKAVEIIDEMSMDPKEWELYRARQMAIMNYNIGMSNAEKKGEKRGEKKGKIKAKEEIAKNMLKEKIEIKIISKVTGLTVKQIEKLMENNT